MSSVGAPAQFQAYYDEPYNVIVQPNRFLYYFRRRWMRELGPVGTSIVIYLRGLCYYNPDKGEKRDICEAKFEEIGEAIGVSRPTVVREMGPHTKDDPAKGIKAGDPVNPALHKFVSRQAQYNLTDKGVRRTGNLYRVRMDDPIHEDDQTHYELLCSQYMARQNQPVESLKPVYKDTRTVTPQVYGKEESSHRSYSETKRSSLKGRGNPAAQIDSQANTNPPAAQNDSQASEGIHSPANQNDAADSLNVLFTNVQTFNVTGKDIDKKQEGKEPARDVIGELITAKVALLVDTLHDKKSESRYRQLVGICEKHNLLSLIDEALQATAAKLKVSTVNKPGAYFQTILLRNLENRGIHVPPAAEASAGTGSVNRAVRESLGVSRATDSTSPTEPMLPSAPTRKAGGSVSPIAVDEIAEIAKLEQGGGPLWESWIGFVEEKRHMYQEATKEMTPSLRQRSLAAFELPDRMRSLWRQWKKAQQ